MPFGQQFPRQRREEPPSPSSPEKQVGWLGLGLRPRGSWRQWAGSPGTGQVVQLPPRACKQDFGHRLWTGQSSLPPLGPRPPSLGDRAGEGAGCFLSPKGSQVWLLIPWERLTKKGPFHGEGGGGSVWPGVGTWAASLCLHLWSCPGSPAWERSWKGVYLLTWVHKHKFTSLQNVKCVHLFEGTLASWYVCVCVCVCV